jgi:transposase
MAVQRVWEGERPSVVIASYGFARPVIYRWLREARGKGRGLRALRSRKGTGRPRRLAPSKSNKFFVGSTAKILANMGSILVCGHDWWCAS